jgi:proteasome lid subunit RPN8/RPN11
MERTFVIAAVLAFGFISARGQGRLLSNDPLTGLPLYPGTDSGIHTGNEPIKMPDTPVCKSKKQAVFYKIYKMKIDDAVAWYSSHLSGFKKVSGYESKRAQIAFRNSDGTILVIVTGEQGAKGENTAAYSVAYERFQPGISEKTVEGLTLGKLVCASN